MLRLSHNTNENQEDNSNDQQHPRLSEPTTTQDHIKPPSLSSSSSSSSPSSSSSSSSPTPTTADLNAKRRKDMFGDCALVEIIHLHDCLRGALTALEKDLTELCHMVLNSTSSSTNDNDSIAPANATTATTATSIPRLLSLSELESRATARFQVIWSVFRAHSAAEDEFIWPTLRLKTEGRIKGCGSPCYQPAANGRCCGGNSGYESSDLNDQAVEQEEYEEDHADEERMFTMMDHLLTRLRKGLLQQRMQQQRQQKEQKTKQNQNNCSSPSSSKRKSNNKDDSNNNDGISTTVSFNYYNNRDSVIDTMKEIQSLVKTLNQHLMVHLEKEEKQCMPLVLKHLSKSEIHDLVGKIMGKRSSDMIAQILTMAVQNLNEADKEAMVNHMKQAMVGTFFDRWLAASGWMDGNSNNTAAAVSAASLVETGAMIPGSQTKSMYNNNDKRSATAAELSVSSMGATPGSPEEKRLKSDGPSTPISSFSQSLNPTGNEITSQAELEKLIRAVATNPSLTSVQKNTTIQGLRASVWKRNQRLLGNVGASDNNNNISRPSNSRSTQRVYLPKAYYQMNAEGEIVCVWKQKKYDDDQDSDDKSKFNNDHETDDEFVPKFSASDLAPTYHDATNKGEVLGCAHYARACKLRHPFSGRLYTCRLCCDQEREASSTFEKDEPLDRYAVTEVACMKCKTLQPAKKECINPDCELHEKGFAKYYCDICHLYDDRPRPIFHCPYCNTCRMGLGLGIDFRHCMRCNACVSLADKDHRCIPQKLQGSCPICHDTLFSSTEPLRGLRCGHVMHLSCFTEYRRGQNYTCPLCMRCMEDMSDYFSLLDQAVRMQTMPASYQNTICNIYCQDCEKTGQCQYHFVGQKCPHCGSYNTREMGRFQSNGNS